MEFVEQAGPFPFRILFVDDDANLGELYANLLRARGYEVKLAHSGFEALADLRQAMPDLVISDLCMPGMSGLELLAILRQRFPWLPLMAVSGSEALGSAALTADLAVDRHECAGSSLYEAIQRLLQARAAVRATTPGRALPWIRSGKEGNSWLCCSECLRDFEVPEAALHEADAAGVHSCPCPHCGLPQYFVTEESRVA